MHSIVTNKVKASADLMSHVNFLWNENADSGNGWWHFNIWGIPAAVKEMNSHIEKQSKVLDSQMKGWKSVGTGDGGEIRYGMHGDKDGIEFWYQKTYER